MKNKYNLISVIALVFFSLNVNAALVTFTCDFPNYVSDEDRGTQSNFKLVFEVDTISKKSYMKGNNGISQVMNMPGKEGISFIEILDSGAVQTTTIVFLPESQFGSAVHSRHTLMFSGLVPSQNYGTCTVEWIIIRLNEKTTPIYIIYSDNN